MHCLLSIDYLYALTNYILCGIHLSIYRFVYKVVIGKDQYPEGCGKTAKEARQQAAQLAWGVIQDQLPSQVNIHYVFFINPIEHV